MVENEAVAVQAFCAELAASGSRADALELVCGWYISDGLREEFIENVFQRQIELAVSSMQSSGLRGWEGTWPGLAETAGRLGVA